MKYQHVYLYEPEFSDLLQNKKLFGAFYLGGHSKNKAVFTCVFNNPNLNGNFSKKFIKEQFQSNLISYKNLTDPYIFNRVSLEKEEPCSEWNKEGNSRLGKFRIVTKENFHEKILDFLKSLYTEAYHRHFVTRLSDVEKEIAAEHAYKLSGHKRMGALPTYETLVKYHVKWHDPAVVKKVSDLLLSDFKYKFLTDKLDYIHDMYFNKKFGE